MAALLSNKLDWELANPLWAQALNPVIANPLLSGRSIQGLTLISGVTTINHKLGRLMQGFFITDIDGPATIYRSALLNDKTITLTSSAECKVNLWVF